MDVTRQSATRAVTVAELARLARLLLVGIVLVLTACGGGGGDSSGGGAAAGDGGDGNATEDPPTDPAPEPNEPGGDVGLLDEQLRALIQQQGLTGDPAASRGFQSRNSFPENDPLARLGRLLFFSQTLSGGFDVACASCHHPDFGNSDGLSLSVGVVPMDRTRLGPDRQLNHSRDLDPRADGGPNMHRNSQTIFNAALHDRALLFDGRVFVLDDETVTGGKGQAIRTPESSNLPDISGASGLLEAMVPFPLLNSNEMRGFFYPELADPADYRNHLVRRLLGVEDAGKMTLNPSYEKRWFPRFLATFGASDSLTMLNIQKAIAAYMETQIFVDTPWRAYVQGDTQSLDDNARQGALLFFRARDQGGLGCASCHAGDRFTDEQFYNVGFPQIGRGFRSAEGDDTGRWRVTRREQDWYAFRTPGLLNVTETAPYGHAGTFATLAELLRYHAHPEQGVNNFFASSDFLARLSQFDTLSVAYPDAEENTRKAVTHASFQGIRDRLPNRSLTDAEVTQLTAFLESLTDACVQDPACIGQWAPARAEDPDGHLLVRDEGTVAPAMDGLEEGRLTPPGPVTLGFPGLAPGATFMELTACDGENSLQGDAFNTGNESFSMRSTEPAFGLGEPHGFNYQSWEGGDGTYLEATMIAGGVSAAYLDQDCWPDLVFAGGDASGIRLYRNLGGRSGFSPLDTALVEDPGTRFTGSATLDINGDYRRELFFGNLPLSFTDAAQMPIYALNADRNYTAVGALVSPRPIYGISFGDVNADGLPEIYLAHWAGFGVDGSAPALWQYQQGDVIAPFDNEAGTTSADVSQMFNFTPAFADLTGNGRQDLVLASDFGTSQVLHNGGDGVENPWFFNVTDRQVITDQNGMGAALGDFFNQGRLDWFVTSVFDPNGEAEANWGVTGNRLYRNTSATTGQPSFADITDSAGVRDGNWGWGACAADFNNDGFLDIFHVNGFGYIPEEIYPEGASQRRRLRYENITGEFRGTPPRLFINNGDGAFTDRATDWGIAVPSEGRGVTCLDYDRDGDIDIGLVDHSTGIQFFENRVGHFFGRHFLNVRVVGAPPQYRGPGHPRPCGCRYRRRFPAPAADARGPGQQQFQCPEPAQPALWPGPGRDREPARGLAEW